MAGYPERLKRRADSLFFDSGGDSFDAMVMAISGSLE